MLKNHRKNDFFTLHGSYFYSKSGSAGVPYYHTCLGYKEKILT